ncbi:MAG TPA: NAD-binding protein, partial [Polyangiaceae bacterium]|nr:NAD-binding protein [Polyangiaceae bacterium]
LPLERVLEVIAASGFASPYYAFKGRAVVERDFATHFSVDLLVKDQSLMLQEAAQQKTPKPGLAAIREVFQAERAQGLGERDISAVFQALERAAGSKT